MNTPERWMPFFKVASESMKCYPKAFWFRSPEAAIWRQIYPDGDSLDRAFQHLDGMMPKVLNEEAGRDMCEPLIRDYKRR
jgi:hypothetical protein